MSSSRRHWMLSDPVPETNREPTVPLASNDTTSSQLAGGRPQKRKLIACLINKCGLLHPVFCGSASIHDQMAAHLSESDRWSECRLNRCIRRLLEAPGPESKFAGAQRPFLCRRGRTEDTFGPSGDAVPRRRIAYRRVLP